MKYTIWYSTEVFADFVIHNTNLKNKEFSKNKLFESDANNPKNFHYQPDHLKQILYLDAPDLIVELDSEPIFSIEETKEAGTGHNAFQRFARLAASVENNVPAFYIYPEAVIIKRQETEAKWDKINPLVFKALDRVMTIYNIPALLYYFPSDFRKYPDALKSPNLVRKGLRLDASGEFPSCPDPRDSDMKSMFNAINVLIDVVEKKGVIAGRTQLLAKQEISQRRDFMLSEFNDKGGTLLMSPLTATKKVPTEYLLNFLTPYRDSKVTTGQLLSSRKETIVYMVNAKFRGDPYPGSLAAIDYLICRDGKTFEDREYNLVMCWGILEVDEKEKTLRVSNPQCSVNDFVNDVKTSEKKNLLGKKYRQIPKSEIPRYYMQVRYGSTFSKVKHIRVYSYFADAILFRDGALWREA